MFAESDILSKEKLENLISGQVLLIEFGDTLSQCGYQDLVSKITSRRIKDLHVIATESGSRYLLVKSEETMKTNKEIIRSRFFLIDQKQPKVIKNSGKVTADFFSIKQGNVDIVEAYVGFTESGDLSKLHFCLEAHSEIEGQESAVFVESFKL